MVSHRNLRWTPIALLLCAAAGASHAPKGARPAAVSSRPTLSAQQIFKRVSPSVMVVESLGADGKVIDFGSGVVIAPGRIITNRHVIKDGVSFRVVHGAEKWPAKPPRGGSGAGRRSRRGRRWPCPPLRPQRSPFGLAGLLYAQGPPENGKQAAETKREEQKPQKGDVSRER